MIEAHFNNKTQHVDNQQALQSILLVVSNDIIYSRAFLLF